jgi:hypothetical protein
VKDLGVTASGCGLLDEILQEDLQDDSSATVTRCKIGKCNPPFVPPLLVEGDRKSSHIENSNARKIHATKIV